MSNNSVPVPIRIINSRYLALLLRLIVGSIFVFYGVSKLPLHSQFVAIVEGYQLLPQLLATAYALTLPWVELLAGSYLILGILLKPSAIVIVLVGISFMIANISAIIQGEQYCGSCFGEVFPLLVSQALALDIFIMIAAILLLTYGGRKHLFSFDSWFTNRQHKSLG